MFALYKNNGVKLDDLLNLNIYCIQANLKIYFSFSNLSVLPKRHDTFP